MSTQVTDTRQVRILSRAFDSWVVEFRIAVSELLDQQQLLLHLRGVKQVIASTQSVPESCLIFDGIVRKNRDGEMVDVVVRIKKRIVESGAPRISFKDECNSSGCSFSHMHALADIYYLDDFEQVTTLDRVMRAVREASVKTELVDQGLISQKLAEISETQSPARGVPLARGRLPETGRDAEVVFYFQVVSESQDVNVLYSSRKVRRGDLLCRKTPPIDGVDSGFNVQGHVLPPRPGLDITIKAGPNASLSLDEVDVVAESDGVVVISRENRQIRLARGIKELPESVTVAVNPVMKLDANEVINLTTSHAVEVTGNLRVGSRIVSDSEVFIEGNVEQGASITAADDILVTGKVIGATLSSQRDIRTNSDVSNSELSAHGDIQVSGAVSGSTVSGDSISAGTVSGCRIVARKNVSVESIGDDEGKVMSTICVGMQEFFTQRLVENQKFLESARANLDRIKLVIGEDLFERVDRANMQTILMRFLSKLHLDTHPKARQQVDVYRRLIEAIPPTIALVEQKERECMEISRKLSEHVSANDGMILVKQRISCPTNVSVDGIQANVEVTSSPVRIGTSGGQIDCNPNIDSGAQGAK